MPSQTSTVGEQPWVQPSSTSPSQSLSTVSQVSAGRKNAVSIEVDGSDDAAAWCSETPDELWIGHRDRPNENLWRDAGALAPSAAAITQYPGGHVEGYPDTFRGLFSRIYADVERGGPSPDPDYPTFVDGHDVVLVTEAIARSSREQRWVTVDR
jgi:predicted dehydrogenase